MKHKYLITPEGIVFTLDYLSNFGDLKYLDMVHMPYRLFKLTDENEEILDIITYNTTQYAHYNGKLYALGGSELTYCLGPLSDKINIVSLPIRYKKTNSLEEVFDMVKELDIHCSIGSFLREFESIDHLYQFIYEKGLDDTEYELLNKSLYYKYPAKAKDMLKLKNCLNIQFLDSTLEVDGFNTVQMFLNNYGQNNSNCISNVSPSIIRTLIFHGII